MALADPVASVTGESCFEEGSDSTSQSGQTSVKSTETLAGEGLDSSSDMDFLQTFLDANLTNSEIDHWISEYSAILDHNLSPEDEQVVPEPEPHQEGSLEHGLDQQLFFPDTGIGGITDIVDPPMSDTHPFPQSHDAYNPLVTNDNTIDCADPQATLLNAAPEPTFADTSIPDEEGPSIANHLPSYKPFYVDLAQFKRAEAEVKALLNSDNPKRTYQPRSLQQPTFPPQQQPIPAQQFPVPAQQLSFPTQPFPFPIQQLSFPTQQSSVAQPLPDNLTMQQLLQMFPGGQLPQPSFVFPPQVGPERNALQFSSPQQNIPFMSRNGGLPGMRPLFVYSPPFPNSNGYIFPQPNLFQGGPAVGPNGLVYPTGNGFYGMMPPQPGQFIYAPPGVAANNISHLPQAFGSRQVSAAPFQVPAQGSTAAGPSNHVHPSGAGVYSAINPQPGQFVYAPLGVVNNFGHFPQTTDSQQVSAYSQTPARTSVTIGKRSRKDSEAPIIRKIHYPCQWNGQCGVLIEGTAAAVEAHLETEHGCKQSVEDDKALAGTESSTTYMNCTWLGCAQEGPMLLNALSQHVVDKHIRTSVGQLTEANGGDVMVRPAVKRRKRTVK